MLSKFLCDTKFCPFLVNNIFDHLSVSCSLLSYGVARCPNIGFILSLLSLTRKKITSSSAARQEGRLGAFPVKVTTTFHFSQSWSSQTWKKRTQGRGVCICHLDDVRAADDQNSTGGLLLCYRFLVNFYQRCSVEIVARTWSSYDRGDCCWLLHFHLSRVYMYRA